MSSISLLRDLSKVSPLYDVIAQNLSVFQDYDLYGKVEVNRTTVWHVGKVADLFRGTLKDSDHPELRVIVKRIRILSDGNSDTTQAKVRTP